MSEIDIAQICAACRAFIVALPRGGRGVEAAGQWLGAFPEACRLGLGDVTESAPGLFRLFVATGLLTSCPSDGAMTGAIRLISSVSPLVTSRSARTWTAWIGSARDLASPIAAAISAVVTPSMLSASRAPPPPVPRRVGSIRSERDRLAAELAAARDELERERRLAATWVTDATCEHDRLIAAVVAAEQERDRMAARVTTVEEEHERRCRADAERLAELASQRDRLKDDLRRASERTAEAARVHGQEIKRITMDRDRARSDLGGEVRRSEALRDELAAVKGELEAKVALVHRMDGRAASLTQRCKDLDASLAAEIVARERLTRAARRAEALLDSARGDVAALRSVLASERQERERLTRSLETERGQLESAAASVERMTQALARLCSQLDLDLAGDADTDTRIELVAATIERERALRRELLRRVEERLRHRNLKLGSFAFIVTCLKGESPQVDYSARVERARREIEDFAEKLVQEDMRALGVNGGAAVSE